jgi:hypothetical protein
MTVSRGPSVQPASCSAWEPAEAGTNRQVTCPAKVGHRQDDGTQYVFTSYTLRLRSLRATLSANGNVGASPQTQQVIIRTNACSTLSRPYANQKLAKRIYAAKAKRKYPQQKRQGLGSSSFSLVG